MTALQGDFCGNMARSDCHKKRLVTRVSCNDLLAVLTNNMVIKYMYI
jgi:hypothetical protein